MATRCFPHSALIVPESLGVVNSIDYDSDTGKCLCGAVWTKQAYQQALSDAPTSSWEAQHEYFLARTGTKINLPAKSVKATSEDVSARWYLITLTQPDTIKEPKFIIKNTLKIIKSKMVSPISWCYCLELTEKGIPHSHIILYTEKYFDYGKIKKFNSSYEGLPWITDIQQEKWNVKAYPQKKRTKPSAEWLATYGLETCVWYSENFPEELKPNDYI
jgi:hypothetical protein